MRLDYLVPIGDKLPIGLYPEPKKRNNVKIEIL